MSEPSVRCAAATEADRCLAVLTLAFSGDPPCRWTWPDARHYLEAFPRFASAFGGGAIERGTAWCCDDFSGVALWLSPGTAPDEAALMKVIEETVPVSRRDAMFTMFEQMGAFHPRETHWHLPLIGVDPGRQGQGIGGALLRQVLTTCDAEQIPAYLEATSPRNVPLYERHGFEALGSIQVADSPAVVPMLRRPRQATAHWGATT
jgi:GNAT superfamily N-acetyltransferase